MKESNVWERRDSAKCTSVFVAAARDSPQAFQKAIWRMHWAFSQLKSGSNPLTQTDTTLIDTIRTTRLNTLTFTGENQSN